MTSDVKAVQVHEKLSIVRRILIDYPFHHIPVISGDRLVGIISVTDMVRLTFEAYGTGDGSIDAVLDERFSIEEVMNRDVITIDKDATIRDAASRLSNGTFHSLPVVSDGDRLVGIVTSTDLIRFLAETC
jgi:CBS domain-containing protein